MYSIENSIGFVIDKRIFSHTVGTADSILPFADQGNKAFPPFLVSIHFINKTPCQRQPNFTSAGKIKMGVILVGESGF